MEPTALDVPTAPSGPTPLSVVSEHIGIRAGYCGGRPHILGHRIKVKHVVTWYESMGLTPAEIVARNPTITLAQVHAALAYYYDHRAEISAEIEEEGRAFEAVKSRGPSLLESL